MLITQFRETLVDQILGVDRSNNIQCQDTTMTSRSTTLLKHVFQEITLKCNRDRKI